jgi:ankyrin repeat protein
MQHVSVHSDTDRHRLFVAAALGGTPSVIQILEWPGMDVNRVDDGGNTVLHHLMTSSVDDGRVIAVMEYLAQKQCGVSFVKANKAGRTPLHMAAGMTQLHKYSMPFDLPDSGNRTTVIRKLCEYGLDVNALDANGNSAMHACVCSDKDEADVLKVLKLLQRHGADLTIKDSMGRTVLHLAVSYRPRTQYVSGWRGGPSYINNRCCVVQYLLDVDLDVCSVDGSGRNGLHHCLQTYLHACELSRTEAGTDADSPGAVDRVSEDRGLPTDDALSEKYLSTGYLSLVTQEHTSMRLATQERKSMRLARQESNIPSKHVHSIHIEDAPLSAVYASTLTKIWLLLQRGVDPAQTDAQGTSPLKLAETHKLATVVDILQGKTKPCWQ